MYTAMLSVENMFGADHDVWSVNVEEDYHEESSRSGVGGSGGSAGGDRAGATGSRAGVGGSGTGRDAPILPKRTSKA